jgi:hypothetical protein
MPEVLFERLGVERGCYRERAFCIEASRGAEDVAMGFYPHKYRRVEVEEIVEGLYGYDCPGSCLLL